jgi:hypothetical protein
MCKLPFESAELIVAIITYAVLEMRKLREFTKKARDDMLIRICRFTAVYATSCHDWLLWFRL